MSGSGPRSLFLFCLLSAALLSGCIAGEDDEIGPVVEVEDSEDVAAEPVREPNPLQNGTNEGCLDMTALYEYPQLQSPLADILTVEEGTGWEARTASGGVHVEFFAAGGAWIDHGDDSGVVPPGATYAIGCAVGGPPQSMVLTAWTYQDGF